jgi:hypothetical protein
VFEGAVLIGFAVASLFAAARIGLEPRDGSSGVGVVFAPWTDADEAFTRAVGTGARFVRFGGWPFVVIVLPEEKGQLRQLRSDAWLLVDPLVLAACLRTPPTAQGRP